MWEHCCGGQGGGLRAIDCGRKMLYGTFPSPPHSLDGSSITPPCAIWIFRCDSISSTYSCQSVGFTYFVQRNLGQDKMKWNFGPKIQRNCALDKMQQNPISDQMQWNLVFKGLHVAVTRFFLQISGWPSFPPWQGVHPRDPRVCGDLDSCKDSKDSKARQGKEDPALPRHYTPFLLDWSDLRCITRNCEHIAGICLILATRRKGFPPSKHQKGSSRECVCLPNLLNSGPNHENEKIITAVCFFYCHYTYKRPGKFLQHPKK